MRDGPILHEKIVKIPTKGQLTAKDEQTKDVSNTKTVCRSVRDVHATRHRPIVLKRRWTPAPHHQARHFSNSDKNRYL